MVDSVRTRLTLWHTGVLAVTLLVFSGGVYALLSNRLHGRLDAELRTTVEGITRLLVHELTEGESEAQATHSALTEHYFPNQAAAIFDAQGNVLAEKPMPGQEHTELPTGFTAKAEEIRLSTLPPRANGAGARVAARVVRAQEHGPYLIFVRQEMAALAEELALLRNAFALAIPLALMLAGAGGWWLARKSLAPVLAMSESARRISAENLAARLPIAHPRDELGRLAATFNEMLARLQSSFTQQRQFMADASHELRTPLAVLQTAASVTLEQPHRDEAEYREALAMIDEQTRRLVRIVDEMFTLARADAGSRELQQQDFYLDELLAETARAAAALAARKDVRIDCVPAPETLAHGDEELLRRLVLNLIDNAIRHTPPGGCVTLQLAREADRHVIIVADTGTGIPAEAQAHIFERFYRVDPARARTSNGAAQSGGAGLGLSIARWIAEAHGGTLTLQRSDAGGSQFRVLLPVGAQG